MSTQKATSRPPLESLPFLQWDLQNLFDVLYSMGVIDPVLKMDWKDLYKNMAQNPDQLKEVFAAVNECKGDKNRLVENLKNLRPSQVQYIAMEVAREYAEFTERQSIH